MDGSTVVMIGIGFTALLLGVFLLLPNLISRSNEVKNPTDIES